MVGAPLVAFGLAAELGSRGPGRRAGRDRRWHGPGLPRGRRPARPGPLDLGSRVASLRRPQPGGRARLARAHAGDRRRPHPVARGNPRGVVRRAAGRTAGRRLDRPGARRGMDPARAGHWPRRPGEARGPATLARDGRGAALAALERRRRARHGRLARRRGPADRCRHAGARGRARERSRPPRAVDRPGPIAGPLAGGALRRRLAEPDDERHDEAQDQRQAVGRTPDAHGVDHEQLQVQEVRLEDHAGQRQAIVGEQQPVQVRLPPGDRTGQEDQREPDAVDRDRHSADPAVLAERDLLAALDRTAGRRAAAQLDDRQVGRDEEPDDVEDGEDEPGVDAEEPAGGRALGQDAHDGDGTAAAASIMAPSSAAPRSPTIACPFEVHRRRGIDALRQLACLVSARTAACCCAGRAAGIPGDDVEAGRVRDRAEPLVAEGALVLADLVGEQPVVERPEAVLLRGAARRPRPRPTRRRWTEDVRPGRPHRDRRSAAFRSRRRSG